MEWWQLALLVVYPISWMIVEAILAYLAIDQLEESLGSLCLLMLLAPLVLVFLPFGAIGTCAGRAIRKGNNK